MEQMPAIRIVIADDSTLLREGLARLFDEAGFTVVATYDSAFPLLRDIVTTRPDLAVLDVRMAPTFRDEGVRAARELKAEHPGIGVLLLSQSAEVDYATDLTESGGEGVGYLLKDRVSSLTELRDAVTRIVAGGTVIDEQIVRELIVRRHDPLSTLTAREVEVLSLMAEGKTNQSIAEALHVVVGSVEKHSTSIFMKLGLDTDSGAHKRVLAVLTWLQRGASDR
jgi:DNA-binding NarL/FixJ family response regulator